MKEENSAKKTLNAHLLYLNDLWNLTNKKKARLIVMEKLNLKINRGYLLKEAFQNSASIVMKNYTV